MLRQRLEREGTPPPELNTETRRAFGNPSRLREQLAELRQFTHLENVLRDLGFAARVLRKSPGFTLTAVLTIALGIGASTAVFSLINALLLRPLPVPDTHQLVVFDYHEDNDAHGGFSAPLFRHLERDHPAFSDVFASSEIQLQIGAGGGSALISSLMVSGQYFRALQTPPLLGRYLSPADDQPGVPSGLPAVISERYWRNILHSDPHVLGRKLLANKVPFTVVGVMPKRFTGTDPTQHPQIFIALASEPLIDAPYNNTAGGYHSWWLTTMGRMKPGVTLEQANASLASVTRSVLSGKDDDAEGAVDWLKDARAQHFRYTTESGSGGFTYLRQLYRQPLQAILVLCCGMLFLACLNLASLLFARAATRQHELATRLAVGASRRRLLQQLLLESLLLAFTGSIAGLAAAPFVARSLAVLLLGGKDPSVYLDTSLDWRVLAAAACACVFATLVIGMAPALHATGRSLNARLKASSLSHADLRTGVLPRLLLASQIALALVLVIGAGLISASLVRMYRTGPGFDPHNVSLVSVRMTKQPLEGEPLIHLYRSLQDKIAALPGVRSASIFSTIPYSGSSMTTTYSMPGGRNTPELFSNWISPQHFQTMRIPLLAGRDFAWSDTLLTAKKIILSRSAADAIFPHQNALGQHVDTGKDAMEVIGIVGDVKYSDIRKPAPFEAYYPITQNSRDKKPSYVFVARVEGPVAPFAAAVRATLARDVPEIPAPVFSTLSWFLDHSLSAQRMMALLAVFFAACALLVTAIGLYGTLAYRTARRTSEIGVRMALGAQRSQVVSLVFRQNVAVTVTGALAGLAAALLAARALSSFLYGTSTHDPLVLAVSTLLLALVASAASLAPAIRAARINPLTAIRTE
ncbi:MAG TPA: ABC transporter permease [Acidobacteriaceae bacterium]